MEIRKLNMLRGLAALVVVISHYANSSGLLKQYLGGGAGQLGVMVFFVLSGFLMSYLYMNSSFDRRNIRSFAAARFARVVPLFVVVVCSSYLFSLIGYKWLIYEIWDPVSLFSHLLLMSGVSVLWTIPAEIQFYVLFVGFWWLFAVAPRMLFLLFVGLVVLLYLLGYPRPQGEVIGLTFDLALIQSLPYFLAGVCFGQLFRFWSPSDRLQSSWFLLALLLIPLLYPGIFSYLFGVSHDMWTDIRVWVLVCLVFFLVVFWVPDSNRLISNKLGDLLGNISYSLYLLHVPILRQLKPYAVEHPILFLFVFVFISILVAYLSYRLLESPSRRYLRGFFNQRSSSQVALAKPE